MPSDREKSVSPFWSGFGSTMTLLPRRSIMRFMYRGRDILRSTPQEGLMEDWSHVYTAINNNCSVSLPNAPHSAECEENAVARR